MESLHIFNNGPLEGEITISGAKNAALPALAATLLTSEVVRLNNVPQVSDVNTLINIIRSFGATADQDQNQVTIQARDITSIKARFEQVRTMRASILVLGPILTRFGEAIVGLPGGCAIGSRPVDLHLKALERMGARIDVTENYIHARCTRLVGADIRFPTRTVTGTENVMMAATLALGTTVIHNAAQEPEVVDLANLLISMGARITGQGSDTIIIKGVNRLHEAQHDIIPDRIETGTWICAAAITRGRVTLNNTRADTLTRFLQRLLGARLPLFCADNFIDIAPHNGLAGIDIMTEPYPGFPTDLQAQTLALMSTAKTKSVIHENIFENRFKHVHELNKLGADIQIAGSQAIINPNSQLVGTTVQATDLRASASLLIAGLAAEGETIIRDIYHLDRGYENIEGKLQSLGARCQRSNLLSQSVDGAVA